MSMLDHDPYDDMPDEEPLDLSEQLDEAIPEVEAALRDFLNSELGLSGEELEVSYYDQEDTGDNTSTLMKVAIYLKDPDHFDSVKEVINEFSYESDGEVEWGDRIDVDDYYDNTTNYHISVESISVNEDESRREPDGDEGCMVDVAIVISAEEGSTKYDERLM